MGNSRKTKLTKVVKDETKDIIAELEDKIAKMEADRENKCTAAKKQLVDMLEVTADKYLTATGVAEAMRVIRFANGEKEPSYASFVEAKRLACRMAGTAVNMKMHAEELAPFEMDKLCDGYYDPDFAQSDAGLTDLAYEMMCIDLCRNVGGAAEDMKSFVTRADEEIDATRKALEEAKAEKED